MRKQSGFTLIELVIVLAVIALLAMMAVPSYVSTTARDEIKESLEIAEKLKPSVADIHLDTGKFPANNKDAGLPAADKLIGNYVFAIEQLDGSLTLFFGNKSVKPLRGKMLTLRAVEVPDSPMSPVSWVCGFSQIPQGMKAVAENRTDVPPALLPVDCRDIPPGTKP